MKSESNMAKGSYAGVKLATETKKLLHEYMGLANLPNVVRPDQLHSTLLYSRKYLPEYKAYGEIKPAWQGHILGLDVFDSRSKDGKIARCLVIKYDCKELSDRHQYLMDTHKAEYDFPDYQPHITISYDIGLIDLTSLPPIEVCVNTIQIVEEYGRDLQIDSAQQPGTSISKS